MQTEVVKAHCLCIRETEWKGKKDDLLVTKACPENHLFCQHDFRKNAWYGFKFLRCCNLGEKNPL